MTTTQPAKTRVESDRDRLTEAETELARIRARDEEINVAVARRFAQATALRQERDACLRAVMMDGDIDQMVTRARELDETATHREQEALLVRASAEIRQRTLVELQDQVKRATLQLHESRVREQIDRMLQDNPALSDMTPIGLRRRAEALLLGENPGAPIFAPKDWHEPKTS